MRRRIFLTGVAAALPITARMGSVLARGPSRRIGFVSWWSPQVAVHAEAFRKALRDLGYVEGRDIAVDVHFTDGDRERTREVVRRLVRDKTDILVVSTTPAVAIAKEEAGSTPIVMSPVSDPIAAGFAASLSRPGGNLTGMSTFSPTLATKRVELIRELRPSLRSLAFLGSSTDINTGGFIRSIGTETERTGLSLSVHLVDGPDGIDAALFAAIRREGAEAVIVQPIFMGHHARIVAQAREAGLPVIADYSLFAEAGAVLTYGIDDFAQMRRAAYFVDRILRGANPADLPIQQPTEYRLVVNAAAARGFGWTIPLSVLAQADEVIE